MSNLTAAERRLGAFSAVSAAAWLILALALGGAADAPFGLVLGGVTSAVCATFTAAEPRHARPVLLAPGLGLAVGGLVLVAGGTVGGGVLALAWGLACIGLVVAAARSVNGSAWRGGPPGPG